MPHTVIACCQLFQASIISVTGQPTWGSHRVGAGFWLTDEALLRAKAEELAKAQYAARKDPADAALMYVALGKKLLLQVRHPPD